MPYTFFHNLSRVTFEAGDGFLSPRGYLIAPANATGQLRELAASVASSRRELVTDNGNFATIGRIRAAFGSEAQLLSEQVRTVEDNLGRSVRRGELPPSLVARFDGLEREVRREALARSLSDEAMVASQRPLGPDRAVGAEDITMACWLSLNIEDRYTSRSRRDYRRLNAAVAKRARRVIDSLDGDEVPFYYPVASAVSYNTAFDAGREFAKAGIEAIAMGFGAFMADANFVDHVTVGRRRIDFGGRLPFRYVRTIVVANGFWAGYEDVAGHAPARFHFLGLGAPIMIPPVVLAASRTTELTFDATSPIKDATRAGLLYVDKPAPLKIRTRKVAHRLAREPSHRWDCPCPFCVAFTAEHPFDYSAGHRWFERTAAVAVKPDDLRPGGPLFSAYPLLAEPSGGELRKAVNFTRIGHNHWILERTMASLERAQRRGSLGNRVNNIIGDYVQHTSPPFAKSVQLALDFANGSL